MRKTRRVLAALGLILGLGACVGGAERVTNDASRDTEETSAPDDGSAEILADATVDASEEVEADTPPVEVHDGDEVETTTTFRCLPDGCIEPGPGCALEEGFCFIEGLCIVDGAPRERSKCELCDAAASPRVWKLADGVACDDGLGCTKDDVCRQGVCQGEVDCPSGSACETPRCNPETNSCDRVVDNGRCRISNTCFSAGQVTGDRCGTCDPEVTQTAWTPGDGQEPDDDFETAHLLERPEALVTTAIDQDPGWKGPWTSSTLSPATDVDVFGFTYATSFSFQRPVLKLTRSDLAPIESCLYIRCLPNADEGTRPQASVTCGGTDTKKSFDDWVGCCRVDTNETLTYNPSSAWCERAGVKVGNDAEAVMTFRRALSGGEAGCLPYILRWGAR